MTTPFFSMESLKSLPLWNEIKKRRHPVSFSLEITARCNNACRHCYVNLPVDDKKAKADELSLEEIKRLADNAVSMGALSCLITGGEPLLRPDFPDIYISLKKMGLLISIFTNATLINHKHIELFREFPPRDIEVTVYGVTKETYEKVTCVSGSFSLFKKGLSALIENGLKPRLKTVALRSNLSELPKIFEFCRKNTKDDFRFDPMLHLRFDRDNKRNRTIIEERLLPEEVVAYEKYDSERFRYLLDNCDRYIFNSADIKRGHRLFNCGAGVWSFAIGYNGLLRLCPSLWHPDCMYDLRTGSLRNAWEVFIPQILRMESDRRAYQEKCGNCNIINLCMWCPAHAYLETGELDTPVENFCRIARARAEMIYSAKSNRS